MAKAVGDLGSFSHPSACQWCQSGHQKFAVHNSRSVVKLVETGCLYNVLIYDMQILWQETIGIETGNGMLMLKQHIVANCLGHAAAALNI